MNQPLVSIIIPCYNNEEFVGMAIESALAQLYPNIEVIVIDDGSSDGSLKVIKSFGKRIRWESIQNHGGGAARNRGLSLALGKWIQFLDADDLLFPEKVSRMMSVSGLQPNEIIFSDFAILEPSSARTCISPRPSGESSSLRYMLEAERLQTSAPLYPTVSLLNVEGFDSSLPCAQEYDLNLRLSLQGWFFKRLPTVLYQVRCRSGSVSSDYVRVLRQHDSIYLKLLEQNTQVSVSQGNLKKLLAWRYVRNARLLTKLGDPEGARQAILRAKQLGLFTGIRKAFSWKSQGLAYLLGPIAAERVIQHITALFNDPRLCIGMASPAHDK